MKSRIWLKIVRELLILTIVILLGCRSEENNKIPITTSSSEARQEFIKGRDLQERLQGKEALEYFDSAIAKDSNFATAYIYSSFGQATATGFFDRLNKAVALADKVSEGERLWILAVEAGVNGQPARQKEYLQKIVELYPEDERAHNQLGIYYFGQQQYNDAIAEFQKTTSINPAYSQAYNMIGYSYRAVSNYDEAENAFKKYIELIPDDPNPYDSYGEFLLKRGRFDEAIATYRQALAKNPNFVASYIGIGTSHCLKGEHDKAREELQKLYKKARDDGERRAALFATTVTYVDQGQIDKALAEMEKQYMMGEKINDSGNMAGDVATMGNILFEAGKYDKAMARYKQSLEITEESNLSQQIKDNARRVFLFNEGRVALRKGNLKLAKSKAKEFSEKAAAASNTFQIWLSHELDGMIALATKDYQAAVKHFQKSNQQNPYTFYRLAKAYEGIGDAANARKACKTAAHFNTINSMNYAFVRQNATRMLKSMKQVDS